MRGFGLWPHDTQRVETPAREGGHRRLVTIAPWTWWFWVRVGFRLLAATEDEGELLMLVETDADVVGRFGLRDPGTVEVAAPDQGAGSAGWGPPDGVGVVGCGAAPRRPVRSGRGRRRVA